MALVVLWEERRGRERESGVKGLCSLMRDRNWGRVWGWVGRRDGHIGMGEGRVASG